MRRRGSTFVDRTPTDGKIYSYHVVATNAAGSSGPSAAVKAVPLPAPPATAPESPSGAWIKNRQGHGITLKWSPVPGATGYVLYRSTNPDGPFRWPEDFTTTVSSATYTDQNDDKKPPKDPDEDSGPRQGLLLPDHGRERGRHFAFGHRSRESEIGPAPPS